MDKRLTNEQVAKVFEAHVGQQCKYTVLDWTEDDTITHVTRSKNTGYWIMSGSKGLPIHEKHTKLLLTPPFKTFEFGPGHPCNGMTAIELGLAIEKELMPVAAGERREAV